MSVSTMAFTGSARNRLYPPFFLMLLPRYRINRTDMLATALLATRLVMGFFEAPVLIRARRLEMFFAGHPRLPHVT